MCLAHRVGNVAATLGVFYPEVADALVGIGQCEVATLGMREAAAVEVELGVIGLAPLYPALEVIHGHLVAVHHLASEVAVYLVQVEAMVAGDEALGLQDVLPQLVNVAGSTREVSRRLDAAAQGTGLYLEPVHVVGLPAMQTQVEVLQLLQHLLCVYT